MAAVWGFGLLILRGRYSPELRLWVVADVWSRYTLGIPGALLASAGLIAQQRTFRQAGMARFGRHSLWAAVAFAWYGVVGQLFTRASPMPPSTVVNQDLFFQIFGFPVQLLRAGAAGVAALFVMLLLRSFEVEIQRQITALQDARLKEARQREALRGELLRQVVAAQEAERQRIARELHDETGQALTAIGLGLRGVTTAMKQGSVSVGDNLHSLEGLVAHSLDELQRIIADLRPSHLDDLGLPAALRWYAGEVDSRTPMDVKVDIQGENQPLPSTVKIALFRVVQEALTNVVKHANATRSEVCLTFGEDAVTVTIRDDGCGFNVESVAQNGRPTWGLLGMRERAALIGGQFSIQSSPGKGTRVKVTTPYRQPEG
jgi:signal transduction histidine kinase